VTDLSGAALDTVMRVADDRTTIVAIDARANGITVLSDTTPFVEAIGDPSQALRIGASGDGPGELRFPSGVAWSGDTLLVWDPSQGRLTSFSRGGRALGILSAPAAIGKIAPRMLRDGYGGAGRIAGTPQGLVVARYGGAVRQPEGLWSIALVRVHPDGVLDTLSVGWPSVDQLRALNDNAQELVAVPLWASCHAFGLATWDPVGGVLRRFPTEGPPAREDTLQTHPVSLTDDLIKINLRHQLDGMLPAKRPEPAVYEQMIESMLASTHGTRPTYPRTAPAFVSMYCDEAGMVWLQHFSLTDAGSGMGRTWTVVDPAGDSHTVRLPKAFRVLAIGSGVVWGVRSGDDGQLFLLKLPLPTH
jgi:hypothetical protein